MKKDLRFGFTESNIVDLKAKLESLFGFIFEEHESSYYGGRYFKFRSDMAGEFILQANFDLIEGEWIEEAHQDRPLLLNISDAPDAEGIQKALARITDCKLINEIAR